MGSGILKINLTAIANNWEKLRKLSQANVNTAAVVKANAYGLGVKEVAPCLWRTGAKTFFVASLEEAIELRGLLPKKAIIFYLNGYSKADLAPVVEFDIIPVLNSCEQVEHFVKQSINKPAAIQFDVGMNRLGIKGVEINDCIRIIKFLKVRLLIGHLSSADEVNAPETPCQLNEFIKLSKFLPLVPKSLASTGGILLGEKFHFDITRPGIGLYGGYPFKTAEPVVSLELPVIQIKELKKSEGVGYNHTFIARKSMRIATVVSGYADGLSRKLSNKGFLYSGNIKCPIIGRVSMDLITVDISSLDTSPKTLHVLGANQSINDFAKQLGTISYEILTSLGSRFERIYNDR